MTEALLAQEPPPAADRLRRMQVVGPLRIAARSSAARNAASPKPLRGRI